MGRLSIVSNLYMNTVSSSSTVHIGDNVNTALSNTVFAVQREVPFFYGNEGSFAAYPFYQRPFPIPQPPEPVAMCIDNWGSYIRVGNVRVMGIAAASVLQIGSNRLNTSESRIKDTRQFVLDKPGPKGQQTFVQVGQPDLIGPNPLAMVHVKQKSEK